MANKPASFSPSTLVDVMRNNKSKKVAVSKIIDSNPQALPVIPKLVVDNNRTSRTLDVDQLQINRGILETINRQVRSNRDNNKNIIKLFPDVELAIQILVSSILSPKKMTDIKLLYKIDKKLPIPLEVSSQLLKTVQEYITETHELEDKLSEIVREALFTSGSYCMAVVPEASVDDVINADLITSYAKESFEGKVDKVLGTLCDSVNITGSSLQSTPLESGKVSAETFVKHLAGGDFINITDNTGLFKFEQIKSDITASLLKRSYRSGTSVAMETREKIEYLDIFRRRNATNSRSGVTIVKTREQTVRKSVGSPMVVRIPSESVIPVSIPGNETEHTGYLIIMDENGRPLSSEMGGDSAQGSRIMNNMDGGVNQSPVQIAYRNLVADTTAKVNVQDLFDMYKDILESQLYNNIKGSLYGKSISIANKNDIFFLMFMRALSNQKTNVLFIPKELMTYFAFYYDEYGVGKSILDNLSILCSMRSILLFSKVMAYAKSAIDVTKVNIELSPEDPDPEKTIEMVKDGVLKLRQNFFPLGINNPVDLVQWIQRAGLQFAYSNNPLIPDVKIDFENARLEHSIPESELEDTLRKQTFQALGLPPETVDNAFSPEFATNVVNNNILLSKRVLVYQKPLCKALSKLIGSIVYNDEQLRDQLRTVVDKHADAIVAVLGQDMKAAFSQSKEQFVEVLLDKLSEHISIELPKPENTNMTNLAAEYDVYKTGLEAVVESIVSSELFSEDIGGALSEHADTVKNVFKHYLLKQWCSDNNYYPEALAFTQRAGKDTDKLISILSGGLTSTMRNSSALLSVMKKFKEAMDADLGGVEGSGGSSSGGGDASSGGGGDGGGNEGADDMEMDDSLDF